MMKNQRGSISAVVVCLTVSAVALTGLVFDGGNRINTYSELSDWAENAGRVGAQFISGIRAGDPYINKNNAVLAMNEFVQPCHCSTSFDVQRKSISVTAWRLVPTRFLGLLGISRQQVRVTRQVELVDG